MNTANKSQKKKLHQINTCNIFQIVVNTKRSNKEIKKLKNSIKKIEFNLNRLKKQELPFNINKHKREIKKEKKILDTKIIEGFEKIINFILSQNTSSPE